MVNMIAKVLQDPLRSVLSWLMNGTTLPALVIWNFILFLVLLGIMLEYSGTESRLVRVLGIIILLYLFLLEIILLALVYLTQLR